MNCHLLVMAAWVLTAAIAGCGQSPTADRVPADESERQLERANVYDRLDPSDKRIVAFVSWLKRKGVTLEYAKNAEGDGGRWRVTQPRTSDEYDVTFSIGSFPSSASEEQMREALDVNLAYQLNAPAHLAMSYAGFSGTHPDAKLPKSHDDLPKVNGLPISKAVERWFMEYKGG